ncbi:MAG: plasmid recombination protein [Ruminococcus sp.]|nr:plasmid recombination protein [Ruminococcus sp.]
MSFQVVRISPPYKKSDLGGLGNELERAKGVEDKNKDIDKDLSYLNKIFVDSGGGFRGKFKQILKDLNCSFNGSKNQTAFEGMVITSDTEFFKSLGWEKGKPAPPAVEEFFDRAYAFALSMIGYKGGDKNIIGARVHYDETTPHLQLYYVPVADEWKQKVYAKDEDGKVLRNDKNSPIQARDENGKTITEKVVSPEAPKVSKGDFWAKRGGKNSYRKMQDAFFELFNVQYGYALERGEVGSDREHTEKYEWEAQQQVAHLAEQDKQIKDNENKLNELEKTKMMTEVQNEIAQDDAEELAAKVADLTTQRDNLLGEVSALTTTKSETTAELADVRSEYSALSAKHGRLEAENERLKAENAKGIQNYIGGIEPYPKEPTSDRLAEWEIFKKSLFKKDDKGRPLDDKGRVLKGRRLEAAIAEKKEWYDSYMKPWYEYDIAVDNWHKNNDSIDAVSKALSHISDLQNEHEAKIAADTRITELSERRTAAVKARASISPAFKAKYSQMIPQSQYKGRRERDESELTQSKQNGHNTSKPKQVERD